MRQEVWEVKGPWCSVFLSVSFWVWICPIVSSGLVFAAGWGQQGEGVRHAPVQHRRGGGHVSAGWAARSCDHAQPVPALSEGQHLRKCVRLCCVGRRTLFSSTFDHFEPAVQTVKHNKCDHILSQLTHYRCRNETLEQLVAVWNEWLH